MRTQIQTDNTLWYHVSMALTCPHTPYKEFTELWSLYTLRQTTGNPLLRLPAKHLHHTHTLTFSINLSIFLTELRLCPPDWPRPSSADLPVCLSSNRSASFSLPSAIRQSVWYWLYVFRAFISTGHITETPHQHCHCLDLLHCFELLHAKATL